MLIAIIYLALFILTIVSMWKVFEKAGQPGWASIVPIYNLYIMCKMVNKPGWWVVLLFIPIANIVFGIMLLHAISLAFGKGVGFTVGLVLLSIVFFPILAFSDATYTKPVEG